MMSLAKLKLNPYNINNLYTNSLVSNTIAATVAPTTAIPFLGKNAKGITIVVEDNDNVYLSDADFQFLTKMLSACQLTIQDVAIINIHKSSVTIADIIAQVHPSSLLLFGVTSLALDMPMLFPTYKVQHYNNMNCLMADKLTELSANTALKTQLWQCFKTLFQLQ